MVPASAPCAVSKMGFLCARCLDQTTESLDGCTVSLNHGLPAPSSGCNSQSAWWGQRAVEHHGRSWLSIPVVGRYGSHYARPREKGDQPIARPARRSPCRLLGNVKTFTTASCSTSSQPAAPPLHRALASGPELTGAQAPTLQGRALQCLNGSDRLGRSRSRGAPRVRRGVSARSACRGHARP